MNGPTPPNWKDLLFTGSIILGLPFIMVLVAGLNLFNLDSNASPPISQASTKEPNPASTAIKTPLASTPSPTPEPTPKPTPTPFKVKTHAPLNKEITRLTKKYRLAKPGIVVIDLKTGISGSLNANKSFPSASVIKLPVMYEVFREIEAGKIKENTTVKILKTNITPSVRLKKDKFPPLKTGQTESIEKLAQLMITRSDNVATNTLMDIIDRKSLNTQMKNLGLKQTTLAHKLSGGFKKVKDTGYSGGRNTTTAQDMSTLLVSLAQNNLLSPRSNTKMLKFLEGQLDKTKIPAKLPKGVKIYHKTGETSGATHDIAIIQSAKSHYVLSLLTDRARGSLTYRNIANFSRDLYIYMEKQNQS